MENLLKQKLDQYNDAVKGTIYDIPWVEGYLLFLNRNLLTSLSERAKGFDEIICDPTQDEALRRLARRALPLVLDAIEIVLARMRVAASG